VGEPHGPACLARLLPTESLAVRVREETSLIERPIAPLAQPSPDLGANERLFATRFLYAGLTAFSLLVASALFLGSPVMAPVGAFAWIAGGLTAVAVVAGVALGRLGRITLAGTFVIVAALVVAALSAWAFPTLRPAVLLLGTLLIPFAMVVGGRPLTLSTSGALALLAVGAGVLPTGTPAELGRPLMAVAAGTFVLHGLAMAAVWRHSQAGYELARGNDTSLAQLRQQLDDEWATQRQLSTALEHERRRSADLVERLSDGVAETDADGLVRRANLAARQIWRKLVGGDIVGQPIALLRERLKAAGERQPLELHSLGTQDGEQQHVLIDRSVVERSERLRTELMQLIAVEMRNPLTSMLTALEMTLGEPLPDGSDRVLAGARRNGQRLMETVVALQEISELETNPQALRRTPSPLRPLVETAIAQATPLAQQSAVNVVVEYNAEGLVDVDADRLRRALLYLLDNAIRVSPQYSTVQVQINRQGNEMQVRVADQGPGIEPDELPLVFHRYVVPSEQGKVAALGLTFCRIVLEAHGGRILVEDSDNGSSFAFSLPLTN